MAKTEDENSTRRSPNGQGIVKSELRGRDLIYIDTDDDVTSIVGKIKKASEAVVALVPPKRIGVLQSVVNLKLLQRAAKNEKKHLVVVTTDPSLTNLATGLEIPIAKNINAQAKVPDMVDDSADDDVIDGNDISIGDLDRRNRSKSPSQKADDDDISAAVAAIETDDKINNDLNANGVPDDEEPRTNTKDKKPKKHPKVPDVNAFRKKLLIGGVLALVLIGSGVWAFVFAPSATIVIKAKTVAKNVTKSLSLIPSTDTDIEKGVLSPVVKQKKTNETVQFDATGTKETGDKAKGEVYVCNKQPKYLPNSDPDSSTKQSGTISVPAGTRLYANGVQFVTDGDVSVDGYSNSQKDDGQNCVSVKATAVTFGDNYNISGNTKLSVSGYDSTRLSASAKGDFTGGSQKTIKVVQQSDLDAAVEKLNGQIDTDGAKKELKSQMGNGTVVIDNSFTASQGDAKPSPNVGEEASGKASVSAEITYTLVGIDRDDLSKVLDNELKNSLAGDNNQKIYSNGIKNVELTGFDSARNGYTVIAKTTGYVGPIIDDNAVKKDATGKKAEEIKAQIKQNFGVDDVEVQMSPFWVSNAPSADKIKVSFTVNE